MAEQTDFEEFADVFSRSVGVEKARDIVVSAAEEIGIGRKDAYETREIVEICEHIEATNDGYVKMVARDLQVRKQAERRFHGLLENIPDPATVVEFTGTEPSVRTVNAAFEEVFGYDAGEIVGESLNDYIVPDRARMQAEEIDQQVMAGQQVEREVQRETADGERRDFLFRARVVETADGSLEAYGIYTDITERRERERELERQNEQLEQFASVVSHDLRNPLHAASARLELAKETGDLEYLDNVAKAHDQMEQLIDDLLTLARQGKTIGELRHADLEECVAQAWASVESASPALEIEDGLGTIQADPERLIELLANLFRNSVEHGSTSDQTESGDAVDHADSGVLIRVGPLDDGFYVEDDGPGIPEEKRDNVLDHGYTTAESGTGFGLSIVQSIVEAHDWTITVTEGTEGGARFEITGLEKDL